MVLPLIPIFAGIGGLLLGKGGGAGVTGDVSSGAIIEFGTIKTKKTENVNGCIMMVNRVAIIK